MVLSDSKLAEWAAGGGIRPFDHTLINPASINVRLGWSVCYPRSKPGRMWRRFENWRDGYAFPTSQGEESDLRWHKPKRFDTLTIKQGDFVLVNTLEHIEVPNDCAANFALRSSWARNGLGHQLAGWGDPGFSGHYTLELFNLHPQPIILRQGDIIGQLVLYRMETIPFVGYEQTGRYNGQVEATPARGRAD